MATIAQRFGQAVRRLREEAGYSQEAFAAAAKIDRTYYSKIERGRANVSLLVVAKIAKTLRVRLADLLNATEEAQGG